MAITVDVFTKVVDQSLRSSSDTIEKHFGKSGQKAGEDFAKALSSGMAKSPEAQRALDKLADLTGKVRIEQEKLNAVNEKANATDAQRIAAAERLQKAERDKARAINEATDAFQRSNVAAGGLLSTMSDLSSGTRLGGVIAQTEVLASRFGGIGLAAGGAIAGVTALTIGVSALGKNLYDVGKMWDDVGDTITARTGRIGESLQSLTDRIKEVSYTTAATPAELANVFGQVAQSVRGSDEQIGALGQKIAQLNSLTGEQTNIRQLGEVFRVFRVESSQQVPILNGLYSVFQQTGIPVNELIGTLQKSGPTLTEFGMSIEQAAGFVAVFEQAGVSADSATKGLKFALKNLAEAGRDPKEGLQQIITEIQNLLAAGDDIGARDMAETRFGKGFPEILRAIKENRLELEALPGLVDQTTDSIGQATDATEDFTEKWQKFKNFWSGTLKPVADDFFNWMNDRMTDVTDWMISKVEQMTGAWSDLVNGSFWEDSALGRLLSGRSLTGDGSGYTYGGSFGAAEGDRGLLSNVPSGRYVSEPGVGDLAQGIGDCTSAIEDLVNMMDGRPTAGREMSTSNADQWLSAHGFVPTSAPVPGAFNVGFNDHHMQATLPGGTKFNWGSDDAAARGGIGDAGAWDDPTFNKHYYRPAGSGNTGPGTIAGFDWWNGGGAATGGGGTIGKPSPSAGVPVPVAPAGTPTPSNFPSPSDVTAAPTTTTPVQMVPSPFGPTYAPVPAGSQPGYNQYGKPGTYLPDPKQIESATQRYQDSLDGINEANDRIKEAKERAAEAAEEASKVEYDLYSTAEERKRAQDKLNNANKAVDAAVKAAERANQGADDAQEALAEAKRGTFREAQKAQQEKAKREASLGELGGPLANDMGISEGLPGIAKWWTTAIANMAFAPLLGQLSAVAAANPVQGGSGMLGMMGARNLASTGSVFPGLGPVSGPGTSTSDSIPALLSNGEYVLSANNVNAMGGVAGVENVLRRAAGGPVTTDLTSQQQAASGDGKGFSGVGGLPLDAAMGATSGLDVLAPGAGQAAKMGIQLINRTVGYGGQLAGIGVGGLLETFLPHGSPLADPGKSWVGKLASGFAGARPSLPNQAGPQEQKQAEQPAAPAIVGQPAPPQTPEQAAALQQQNGKATNPNAPLVKIDTMVNNTPDKGRTIADQIAYSTMVSHGAGWQR